MAASDVRPTLLRGGRVLDPAAGIDAALDVLVSHDGVVVDPQRVPAQARIVDVTGCWVMPGLIDLQVHFREPGLVHKEDLMSGSRAALCGGVTTAVVMPNTKPVLDDPALVAAQSADTTRKGGIRILVAAAATKGMLGKEISDYAALKAAGAVAITDDGLPVLDDAVMEASLRSCAAHDLLFMQHAEDTRITRHAPMNHSPTSDAAGVDGQPASAEGEIVERDLRLTALTGARYHVLHCSTKRSLDAVRAAKARGLRVSCEASPHHLLLSDDNVVRDGVTQASSPDDLDPNRKMNPPLRSRADRAAIVGGIIDGTVDAVATDHAPHHADEKARGIVDAPFGVIGLETAFAALVGFVLEGAITPTRAVELMTSGPARVLGMSDRLGTFAGGTGDVCVFDPRVAWDVTPGALLSRSKNSAFFGMRFRGRVVQTWVGGLLAYERIA